MQFSAADITAMLDAFADTIIIGAAPYFDQVGEFDAVATLDAVGSSGGVEYPCLFDAPGKVLNMFTGGIESAEPSVIMSAALAASSGVAHGTPVVIESRLYYVIAIDPDGSGFTRLALSVEAP